MVTRLTNLALNKSAKQFVLQLRLNKIYMLSIFNIFYLFNDNLYRRNYRRSKHI